MTPATLRLAAGTLLMAVALLLFAPMAALASGENAATDVSNATSEHAAAGEHTKSLNWFNKDADEGMNIKDKRPPLAFMFFNFAVVVVVLYFLARKPISKLLQKRRDNIASAIEEAEALKKEAEAAIEAARVRMEAMDAEMTALRNTIVEAGVMQARHVEEETVLRSARLRDDTRAIVAHEITRLSVELRAEVVEEIVAAAAKLIAQKITAADQARLAESYISGIAGSADTGAEHQ